MDHVLPVRQEVDEEADDAGTRLPFSLSLLMHPWCLAYGMVSPTVRAGFTFPPLWNQSPGHAQRYAAGIT